MNTSLVFKNFLFSIIKYIIKTGLVKRLVAAFIAAAVVVTSPALSTAENRCEERKSGASVPAIEDRDSPMRMLLTQKGQSPSGTVPVLLAPETRVGAKVRKKSSRVMSAVAAQNEPASPPDVIPLNRARDGAIERALRLTGGSTKWVARLLHIGNVVIQNFLRKRNKSPADYADPNIRAVPAHISPWSHEKRRRILEAVKAAEGSYAIAAKWLGVGRSSIYRNLPHSESSARDKILQVLLVHNGSVKETAASLRVSEPALIAALARYDVFISEKTGCVDAGQIEKIKEEVGLPENPDTKGIVASCAFEVGLLMQKIKKPGFFTTKASRQKDLKNIASELKKDPSNSELELDLLAQLAQMAPELLPERRGRKQEPTRAQLEAALALSKRIPLDEAQGATGGYVGELVSGEGKTLAIALAAAVEASKGHTVHVMTANNYLAQWSAMEMMPLYNALGLSVGVLDEDKQVQHRITFNRQSKCFEIDKLPRNATADIVYGKSSAFVYDFLFDRIRMSSERVQQKHDVLFVDEADSILIDEATTPLVAAVLGKKNLPTHVYARMLKFAQELSPKIDYTFDAPKQLIKLTESGNIRLSKFADILKEEFPPAEWPDFQKRMPEIVTQLLRAERYFRRDVDYVVKDGQVVVVDEYTGRLEPERRFAFGLHEAICIKEGLPIPHSAKELGGMTYPQYLRLYSHVAAITGTVHEAASEFWRRYHLQLLQIPPAREPQRSDLPDLIFRTKEEKTDAVVRKIKDVSYNEKRPIIVGARTIAESLMLSERLNAEGISHQLLNGLQDEEEAKLIERAGMLDKDSNGMITIVTNIAGRGTDFVVTAEVLSRGGIFILGTERHAARRIDWQLRGRGGRQGELATSQFYISLEDGLIQNYGEAITKRFLDALKLPKDYKGPIEDAELHILIDEIQEAAEAKNRELRDHNLSLVSAVEFQRWLIDELQENLRISDNLLPRKEFHKGLVNLWRRAHPARELFDINVMSLSFLAVEYTQGPPLFDDRILHSKETGHYTSSSHRLAELLEMRWADHWAKMRRLEGQLLSTTMPLIEQRKIYEQVAAEEWESFLKGIARDYDYLTQNSAIGDREENIRAWLNELMEKSHGNRREFRRLLRKEAPELDPEDVFEFINGQPILKNLFVVVPPFSKNEYQIFVRAIGQRFREERERQGLSIKDAVKVAGFTSAQEVKDVETGRATLSFYVRMQKALKVDILTNAFYGEEWLGKVEPNPISQAVGEAAIGAAFVKPMRQDRLLGELVNRAGFDTDRLEKAWDGIMIDWELLGRLARFRFGGKASLMERLYGVLIAERKTAMMQNLSDARGEISTSQLAPPSRLDKEKDSEWDKTLRAAVKIRVENEILDVKRNEVKSLVLLFLQNNKPFQAQPNEAYFSERRIGLLMSVLLPIYKEWESSGDRISIGTYHKVGGILLADYLYRHLKISGKLTKEAFFCLQILALQGVESFASSIEQRSDKSSLIKLFEDACASQPQPRVIEQIKNEKVGQIGDMVPMAFATFRMHLDTLKNPPMPSEPPKRTRRHNDPTY